MDGDTIQTLIGVFHYCDHLIELENNPSLIRRLILSILLNFIKPITNFNWDDCLQNSLMHSSLDVVVSPPRMVYDNMKLFELLQTTSNPYQILIILNLLKPILLPAKSSFYLQAVSNLSFPS